MKMDQQQYECPFFKKEFVNVVPELNAGAYETGIEEIVNGSKGVVCFFALFRYNRFRVAIFPKDDDYGVSQSIGLMQTCKIHSILDFKDKDGIVWMLYNENLITEKKKRELSLLCIDLSLLINGLFGIKEPKEGHFEVLYDNR